MPIEVHVAVAPTATFFAQLHLLAASLRRFGALDDPRIVATVSPDVEPFDLAEANPWSRDYGVEWRWVDPDLYREWGIAATALERLRYEFDSTDVLVVDADTICTGPIDRLPELAGKGIAGVTAFVSPEGSFTFRGSRPDSSAGFWPALFEGAGLAPPVLEREYSGWGLLDQDPRHRHCPPYFNLGVLAASGATMNALGRGIYDELTLVERFGSSIFRCQLALALALARLETPSTELPLRFNFPNEQRLWERYPDEAAEVRVMHYLRRHEVDRTDFLRDRVRLRAFLERPDLSPVGRHLQSTVRALATEIEPRLPAESDDAGGDERSRYPFVRPALPPPEEWTPFLRPAYEARRFSNHGPVASRLERAIEARFGAAERRAVLVASATAGLVASLLALGIRGRVAMPAFTFPASAHAVILAGCVPVFCDIDEESWELDPDAAARVAAARGCDAILHVRTFGLCRELDAIGRVASESGLPLIVDSAAAFGGRNASGAAIGAAGELEVFSFHATKVFAVGEGGVVLAPPRLASRIRRVSNFALNGDDVTGRGMNAKLSELPAAVGLAMIHRLTAHIEVRDHAVEAFLEAARTSGATGPGQPGRPPWQCLPLLAPTASRRDAALAELRSRGIEARPYYSPGLHRTRAFARYATEPLPVTDEISSRILCFPVYSDFAEAEIRELAGELAGALAVTEDREPSTARA